MSAVVEPEITLLELVETLSKQGGSESEIVETVCSMVASRRVCLIGQFDGRHVGHAVTASRGSSQIH